MKQLVNMIELLNVKNSFRMTKRLKIGATESNFRQLNLSLRTPPFSFHVNFAFVFSQIWMKWENMLCFFDWEKIFHMQNHKLLANLEKVSPIKNEPLWMKIKNSTNIVGFQRIIMET